MRNRAVLKGDVDEENTGVARTVKTAIDWLERRGGEKDPFVLWLDLFSPHGPWDPPQPYRDQYVTVEPDEFEAGEEGDLVEENPEDPDEDIEIEDVAALIDVPGGAVGDVLSEAELFRLRRTYAGTVSLVNRWLGVLFDAMRRMGRMDDTLVIFTSDQGEPLGEHGFVRRFRPWLYEELIHTPLIIRMPGGRHGGIRHQALVQTVDILPTIFSALGLPPIGNDPSPIHGHDLLSLVRGELTKVRDYACLGMDVAEFAIRTHLWHLVVPMVESDPEEPRSPELFRKPEDRWDQNNVIEQFTEVAEHLELTLRRFVEVIGRDALEELPFLRDIARFGDPLTDGRSRIPVGARHRARRLHLAPTLRAPNSVLGTGQAGLRRHRQGMGVAAIPGTAASFTRARLVVKERLEEAWFLHLDDRALAGL